MAHCHCSCCCCHCHCQCSKKHYCPPKYTYTNPTINFPFYQQGLSGTSSPNQSPPYTYLGGNTYTIQC